MSDSILEWPAFAGETTLPAGEICYERGIWGKVQGARTDFRWIARSSDLELAEPGLARLLSLGTEDQPETAQLWLRRGSELAPTWYSASLYPSRARDASGRTGFLEKQVLAWSPPPGTPAALGALLLLPKAASPKAADAWWSRSGDPAWEDPRFSLALPGPDEEPLPFQPEDLASIFREGVTELRELVRRDADALKRLYGQLLDGRRPAWLTGLQRPLSPQALAALLLPLPRDLADSLSVAGWLPSSRASIENLAVHWDVIVVPPHLMNQVGPQEVSPEAAARGEEMAMALLELNPRWIDPPDHPTAAPLEPLDTNLFVEALVEPPRVKHGPPLSPLTALRPGACIALPPPSSRASDLLKELHAFACTVDRRWPDLDRWARKPLSQLDDPLPEVTLFSSWIAQLEWQRPEHVDAEQWEIKLDLLRSAALVLRPRADTFETIGLPRGRHVPALLFSLVVNKQLLAEMGESLLGKALQHSLKREPNPWSLRLESALDEWPTSKGASWLKPRIQKELKAARSARS